MMAISPQGHPVMQVIEKVSESNSSNPLQGRLGLQGAHKGQEHV